MVVNGGVTVPINGGVVVPMGPDRSTHESKWRRSIAVFCSKWGFRLLFFSPRCPEIEALATIVYLKYLIVKHVTIFLSFEFLNFFFYLPDIPEFSWGTLDIFSIACDL